MEAFSWFKTHGVDLLQSAGIVLGFAFTAWNVRADSKARRVANLLTLTGQHRDLWTRIYERPELSRVLKENVDPGVEPVTEHEELFVLFVILHLSSAQEAIKEGMFAAPEGLSKDIKWFFSKPIPHKVWQRIRQFQDADFVNFVEHHLK